MRGKGKRGVGRRLLDLLYPRRCVWCQRWLEPEEEEECPLCRSMVSLLARPGGIQRGPYGVCAVPYFYDDRVQTGIRAMKFQKRWDAVPAFARHLAHHTAAYLGGEFDAVTFVPVGRARLRQRGYDQARLLAEEMAKLWDTQALPLLHRTRETGPQSLIRSPEERRANVLGAFAASEEAGGRRVLLVDDVVTTGATLAACRDALLLAGAASVVCAALAAPRNLPPSPPEPAER